MAVLELDTNSALLLTTATFALVYLAGTAAAVVLLEGWGRSAALLSMVASLGLVAADRDGASWCLSASEPSGVLWARARSRSASVP